MKITIPKAAVVTAFNAALSGFQVRLQTFGPKDGTSWYQNQSRILLPNGTSVPIRIDEYTFKVTRFRKLRYYVDKMSSSTIQATVDGERIRIDVHFESHGEEIKAKCIRRRFGKWGECTLDMERDVHLNDTILSISLVPVAYKGSIAYSDPRATLRTDVEIANRLCNTFAGICGWIEGKIKKELASEVEKSVLEKLNDDEDEDSMKKLVANKVKNAPGLRTYLEDRKVLEVESQGNNFVVTVGD